MGQMNRGTHDQTTDERSDEDNGKMTLPPPVSKRVSKWVQPPDRTTRSVQQLTGNIPGKIQNMAPHIDDLIPCSVFTLYFASVITTLVEETNRYYKQYWDRLDN
jgi:hypothetical protein